MYKMAISFAMLLLTAGTSSAGDFCVVVCDDAEQRSRISTCPSPTFRSSLEIVADFQLIAHGDAPEWPFGAFSNGFFSFCSKTEHQALMTAVVAVIPVADGTRRRQLTDFACMVGPKRALAAIEDELRRPSLDPSARKALEKAQGTVTRCADRRPSQAG